MSYTAPPILQFSMPMVPAAFTYGAWTRMLTISGLASAAWPTANQARFYPMRIPAGVVVKRLWAQVGTTGGTDTWDLGIYTDGGTQVVHMGSTTAGTASNVQFMDITDTYLAPGAYYMAMSSSGTTAHTMSLAVTTTFTPFIGMLQMATAHPLPATATFATTAAGSIPLIGYCTTATP